MTCHETKCLGCVLIILGTIVYNYKEMKHDDANLIGILTVFSNALLCAVDRIVKKLIHSLDINKPTIVFLNNSFCIFPISYVLYADSDRLTAFILTIIAERKLYTLVLATALIGVFLNAAGVQLQSLVSSTQMTVLNICNKLVLICALYRDIQRNLIPRQVCRNTHQFYRMRGIQHRPLNCNNMSNDDEYDKIEYKKVLTSVSIDETETKLKLIPKIEFMSAKCVIRVMCAICVNCECERISEKYGLCPRSCCIMLQAGHNVHINTSSTAFNEVIENIEQSSLLCSNLCNDYSAS